MENLIGKDLADIEKAEERWQTITTQVEGLWKLYEETVTLAYQNRDRMLLSLLKEWEKAILGIAETAGIKLLLDEAISKPLHEFTRRD